MNSTQSSPVLTLRIRDLILPLDASSDPIVFLRRHIADRLRVPAGSLSDIVVRRRAMDARRKPPHYVVTVDVTMPATQAQRLLQAGKAEEPPHKPIMRWRMRHVPDGPRPVVIGAGPAGLFAALTLAEAGYAPIIFERGKPVDTRVKDVSKLYSQGILNPESNVCYGEGGAGTFSDGKLYTRVNDERVQRVLEILVAQGARPDILVNARPHVGTDKLVDLLRALRAHLIQLGATFHFDSAVTDLTLTHGQIRSITLASGETIDATRVILATGHSARHVWEVLHRAGIALEARPFAVGFRIEHPQPLIDSIRYGDAATRYDLPAADYRLTYNEPHGAQRGVYSFCMCPGGVVVTTPTTQDALCINGMSHASRSGRYANSALVVTVNPHDFAAHATGTPVRDTLFAGVQFQESVEQHAYRMGGGAFRAPASRVTDFLAGRASSDVGPTSYRRGLQAADLTQLYPDDVITALQNAIRSFDRTMRGFITQEATLIGVETRTASPIRVPRGQDLQCVGAQGLYPAGEGMGYGGGIVSAAVDGIRTAEALLQAAGATFEEVSSHTIGSPSSLMSF